jgi:hypothetical protein
MDRGVFEHRFRDLEQESDELGLRNTSELPEEAASAAESAVEAAFPADYKWFIGRYWTGIFGGVDLFTLDPRDSFCIAARQPENALGRFVAFCDDRFGNAYCFPVENGRCVDRVVYVPVLTSEFTGDMVTGGFLDFVAARAGN